MERDRWLTPFKVGIFVLVGAVCVVVMAALVSKPESHEDRVHVYAYLGDVTGLAVRSQVMSSGIPVGEITKIALEEGKARVDFTVSKEIRPVVGTQLSEGVWKNGISAAKQQVGFVGDFYLKVSPGVEGRPLQDGDRVFNVFEPPSIGKMMESFDDIIHNVNVVVEALKELIANDSSQAQLKEIIDNVTQLTRLLKTVIEDNSNQLGNIVDNAEAISNDVRALTRSGGESVQTILRDVEYVVADVRSIVSDSSGDLQSGLGSLRGSLNSLQSTLDSLNYSLQNIQDITDKINEGEGTIGELVNNPTIAEKTESILTEADNIIGRIGRLKTIVDVRSEYHFNAAQLKHVVGLRLQPSPDKYYLVELIDDYRGKSSGVSEVITSDETGEDPVITRTKVVTEDRFKFSVQFAKTWFLTNWLGITGRFGIIEQTGGVGTNILLLENGNLNIQADLFDFSSSRFPRLRMFGSYRFLDLVYLMGGIDDVLHADRRQYMIGLGIRFNDEDLKALIGTTGVPSVN